MFEDTPLVLVEDAAHLAEVAQKFARASVLAIDTESDSSYSYQEKVCLLQISDLTTDYLVDPLAVPDLSPLEPIFGDRSITKVLHGADYDIVCLKRDFGFRVRGLFDTLVAAQLLGTERIGLADLVTHWFGVELDKKFQRYNWALRPLLPEHIEYARGDTHYLLALREILQRRLRAAGRVRHFREECRILERREWGGKPFDPEGWADLKQAGTLDDVSRRVLRRLYQYRDAQARRMDRPAYKVIPEDVLVAVARALPETETALDAVIDRRSALRRRHGRALLAEVAHGLEDTTALPDPRKRGRGAPKKERTSRPRTGPRTRLHGRQAERVLAELKVWRNRVLARDPSMSPTTVASNATLKWIAQMRPTNLTELEAVPEVRRWQVIDFGVELIELLDKVAPLDGKA
jgi:ribonuclease D